MSRYIDAEWLKIALELYRAVDLSEVPSIDIVRCGECKMWMSEHLCQWWSRYGTVETDADDFCSYGERKEQ